MIRYLVRERHAHTMRGFLKHWGAALRDVVEVLPYEDLFRRRELPAGTYIFSDLERLATSEKRLAAELSERIDDAGSRALNHPTRALTRRPLLTALAAEGINPFRVHRLAGARDLRYPVFLRTEHEHDGALTPLLRGPRELALAVLGLARCPLRLRAGLLVVEFEDTRDAAGVFRKYSTLRIGDAFLPRHIFLSRHWMIKVSDIVDASTVREEEEFLREFPHREQVIRAFERARIEYGRIDYSVRGGRIVVWEINTNPGLVPAIGKVHPERLASQSCAAARIVETLRVFDRESTGSRPIRAFARGDRPRIWSAAVAGRMLG